VGKEFHHRVGSSPTPVFILSQINPVRALHRFIFSRSILLLSCTKSQLNIPSLSFYQIDQSMSEGTWIRFVPTWQVEISRHTVGKITIGKDSCVCVWWYEDKSVLNCQMLWKDAFVVHWNWVCCCCIYIDGLRYDTMFGLTAGTWTRTSRISAIRPSDVQFDLRDIESLSCNQCSSENAEWITYSERWFLALGIQHAIHMLHIILSSVVCPAVQYFCTLSHKCHDFRKTVTGPKYDFISSTNLCEIFLILRRTERDLIKNVLRFVCKVQTVVVVRV